MSVPSVPASSELFGDDVDITALMRVGHPQIAEGDAYILERIDLIRERVDRPLKIFNIGCGTGWLAAKLARKMPDADIIANELDPHHVSQLRRRLEGTRARIFERSFAAFREPVDVLVSWGSHHHLPPAYVDHFRPLLGAAGTFVLGDEFCPDYLTDEDAARVLAAQTLRVARGFLLTRHEEIATFDATGVIPEWSRALERRRQQALWTWYRYVVDHAMERGIIAVAVDELRAAHGDLVTEYGDEHKLAARIVERDVTLRGFRSSSRKTFGPEDAPSLQSFVVFELVPSD
jgi:SAM-dependent methyltransferase